MNFILVYNGNKENNENILNNLTNSIEKVYLNIFDINKFKNIIHDYNYVIYLNDKTNYDFKNIDNDINNSIDIIKNNINIEQLLFNNFKYSIIDNKISNKKSDYYKNEITIFKVNNYIKNNINYLDYVKNNFNRLFLPSIIKTSLFFNEFEFNETEHSEFNYLLNKRINRFVLNENIFYNIVSTYNTINNINDDLTIVTGFIQLNEKKIQKYERQTYDYITSSIDTLKMNINMVIYVTKEIVEHVYNIRKQFNLLNKTKVIEININEFMYFYDKLNIVEENVNNNDHNYSSAKKILTVVSRYNYLKDSIENNYFKSKYFAWIDFGAGHIVNIPNDIIFNDNFENKVKIGWIARYNKNKNMFTYNYKSLAGGFFIGKKEIMTELIKLHKYYFELLMNYGYTINDDKLLFFIFENNPFLFKTYFTDYKHIIEKLLK